MLYIIAWLVVGMCSYHIWLSRFNFVLQEWGGVHSFFQKWSEKDDPSLQLETEETHHKVMVLAFGGLSLLLWPLVLYMVIKSYLNIDYYRNYARSEIEGD